MLSTSEIEKCLTGHSLTLLNDWLPRGKLSCEEYLAYNPTRNDSSLGSFKINTRTGAWLDNATGDKGHGLISLLAYIRHAGDQVAALREARALAVTLQAMPAHQQTKQVRQPKPAVPITGEQQSLLDLEPPEWTLDVDPVTASWEYRNKQGELLFWVVRAEREGGKVTLPVRWLPERNDYSWSLPDFPEGVPPFNLHQHEKDKGKPVVWAEGEKTATALQKLYGDKAVAMTTQGGSNSLTKSDLSCLTTISKLKVYPDADEAGLRYALQLVASAILKGVSDIQVHDMRGAGWIDGQDAADFPELTVHDLEADLINGLSWFHAQRPQDKAEAVTAVCAAMSELEYQVTRKKAAQLADLKVSYLDAQVLQKIASKSAEEEDESEQPLTPEEKQELREELWPQVQEIATSKNVLDLLVKTLHEKMGVVGEEHALKILYLAMISRHTTGSDDRPLSVISKGESSGGKSYTAKAILKLFEEGEAWFQISTLSEKALIYSDRVWANKVLFIPEANQLHQENSELLLSLLRQLLTDGCISHEVTIKDPQTGEMGTQIFKKDGPTGLFVGTTRDGLDHELETRCISLFVDESPEQTMAIIRADARRRAGNLVKGDPEKITKQWQAFDKWLSLQPSHNVIVPFAEAIPEGLIYNPVRFRRDIPSTFYGLVRAHTLVHCMNREKAPDGSLIATLEDYAAARELINPALARTVGIKQTEKSDRVLAWVYEQMDEDMRAGRKSLTLSVRSIAQGTQIPKATIHYQLSKLVEQGQLINLELQPKKPARLKLGPEFQLPDDNDGLVLQSAEWVAEYLARNSPKQA